MTKMNSTMTKMLQAHSSITPAKLLSANDPLPRVFKNSRIAEGAISDGSRFGPAVAIAAGTVTGTGDAEEEGAADVGGVGIGGLDSGSVVIRIKVTVSSQKAHAARGSRCGARACNRELGTAADIPIG